MKPWRGNAGGERCIRLPPAAMKIISFIDEHLLIRRILDHLDLWQQRIPKGLPPPVESIPETIICEEIDDGWGRYDGTDVSMH